MVSNRLKLVIQHLRRATLVHDGAGLTDGQLLESYICNREEAAFAALVRRHGPMVWGVCLRILRSYHDAEDAFQATFLVLIRKAASIRPREMVGNWLYGVAHQTALKASQTVAKRRARERPMVEMPEPAAKPEDLWRDLQPVLDQELSRLPDKYRAVLVLCDLEAKTRREVARQLNVPEGTVASRLATARTMLAKRLARHGLAVSGGALAALLSENAVATGVPALVMSSAIKTVSLLATGQAAGVVSHKVAFLAEGVLKTMFLTKIKTAIATLLVAGIIGTGATGLAYRAIAAGASSEVQGLGAKSNASVGDQEETAKEALRRVEAELLRLRSEIKVLREELQQMRFGGREKKEEKPADGLNNAAAAPGAANKTTLKLYTLRHANAAEVANTLGQLFDVANQAKAGQPITPRIVAHQGTNTLIVQGNQHDLDVIEAIITRLDEQTRAQGEKEGAKK